MIANEKKRCSRIVNFAVLADHKVKLKESEKRDEYLDLARELKKLWNMKVTVIPIAIGALGTVTKRLVQRLEDLEIKGRVETIQTIALLRSAKILRESRRLKETCCHSESSRKSSANTGVLDLVRELKKLWNMKVTVIQIVFGGLGTVTTGLIKGLEALEIGEREETMQTIALLRLARILRRFLETWGDLLSLKPLADVNNSQWVIVNFAVPADHRVKLKESEKKNKYLDLAWELKKKLYLVLLVQSLMD